LLAEFNITVHGCCFYDMPADRMSSEQPIVGLQLSKLLFVIWINTKPQLGFT